MAYDILIKNGRVIDGTGLPGYRADVGVRGGKIVETGRLSGPAGRTIDADGLAVAPGFIDIHTHYDAQVFWDPLASSSCWHGITSVVMGNCGFTIAPAKEKGHSYLLRMLARVEAMSLGSLEAGVPWGWRTIPEYLDRLDKRLGINVASLVGHSAVRYDVMGEAALERAATEDEVRRMQNVVREGMAAGAYGFSTSQQVTHVDMDGRPVPSRQATHDEIVALASVLREFNAGEVEMVPSSLATGVSQEDRELLVRLGRETGRFVSWVEYFYRPDDPERWKDLALFMEEANRKYGVRLYGVAGTILTRTGFNLAHTGMFDRIAEWREFFAKPLEERKRLLSKPETVQALRQAAESAKVHQNHRPRWENIYVDCAALPKNKALEGKTIGDIARQRKMHPAEVFFGLAAEEGLQTGFVQRRFKPEDEASVGELMQSPYAITGVSDAGAHTQQFCQADFTTHLLAYWRRERGLVSLEEGVRRLTSVPATLMGFRDRGRIQEGLAADLVVFDPDEVASGAQEIAGDLPDGSSRTVLRSKGYKNTIVNGQVLLEDGVHTGAYPGKVLRSNWTR